MFVTGDLAELQLVAWHDKLPDYSDSSLAPYRKLKGFVRRVTAGGAWMVAGYIRSALRDVWRTVCDAPISVRTIKIDEDFVDENPGEDSPFRWWVSREHDSEGANSQEFCRHFSVEAGIHSIDVKTNGTLIKTPWKFTAIQGGKIVTGMRSDEEHEKGRRSECDFGKGEITIDLAGHGANPVPPGKAPIGLVTNSVNSVPWARWTRPIVIAPKFPKLRMAVRFVKDDELFLKRSQLKNLRPWHEVQQLVQPILGPLKKFLEDEHEIGKNVSAAFLILSDNWRRIPPREAAGYFVFYNKDMKNANWKIWTSHSDIALKRTGAEEETYWFHQGDSPERAEKIAGRVGATRALAKFNSSTFVAFPISHELARILDPNRRPLNEIHGPSAFVSTIRSRHPAMYGEPPLPPIRPIWDVAFCDGQNSKKSIRLTTPNGYLFPDNWIRDQQEPFEAWIASNRNELAPHMKFDTKEQKLERSIEWGLSRYHRHEMYMPEWTHCPKEDETGIDREFQHFVFTDLNFGFRRICEETELSRIGVVEGLNLHFQKLANLTAPAEGQFDEQDTTNWLASILVTISRKRESLRLKELDDERKVVEAKSERDKILASQIEQPATDADANRLASINSSIETLSNTVKETIDLQSELIALETTTASLLPGLGNGTTTFSEIEDVRAKASKLGIAPPPKVSSVGVPDWWYPLIKWSLFPWPNNSTPHPHLPTPIREGKKTGEVDQQVHTLMAKQRCEVEKVLPKRGWIIGIIGRQLPLRDLITCDDCDSWAEDDIWDLLRKAELTVDSNETSDEVESFVRVVKKGSDRNIPLFRDRTIVILSGHLLRASGARISYRLSWEQTALDCVRELENNPKLKPLLDFRHVVIRFGCVGAVHISRSDSSGGSHANSLFYDATAKESYFRDPEESGRVIGSNSTFAARILQALIETEEDGSVDSDNAVKHGISQAILDCQELYRTGYGDTFKDSDPYLLDITAPTDVLFHSKPLFSNK